MAEAKAGDGVAGRFPVGNQALTCEMFLEVFAALRPRAWYGISDQVPRGIVYVFGRYLPDLCFVCHPTDLKKILEGLPGVELTHLRKYSRRVQPTADETCATRCADCGRVLTIMTQWQLVEELAGVAIAIPLCKKCYEEHLEKKEVK